jgi:hypothetical protein
LLKISQRLPLKYKAPSILAESEAEMLSLAEITARWNMVRNDLRIFLEKWEDRHVKKKIYKHAVSGRLNMVHAVSFFREHAMHHLPQIKRLLK